MADVTKITPAEARAKVTAGEALLVCAYEDPAKCEELRLEGALTYQEFQQRLPSLAEDQQVVFYCA
jgi:hypothetical protein